MLTPPHKSNRRRRSPDKTLVKKNNAKIVYPEHTGSEFFAGSVLVESPPPSSVPIPGFFAKNFVSVGKDDATTELRRILGLEDLGKLVWMMVIKAWFGL
ncbi:hypothetical protein QVD17_11879 [Tagetes erecta]|uniref:Uncharacterized protein n=1 Tax=Tagetes erecta TaxID=13708 RepID=A0AAD8KU92_TARER|nr:hypothetical protein QVD17_11879 [Tagetes erecta]